MVQGITLYVNCGNFYNVYFYDETTANPSIDDGLSEVTSLGFSVANATGTLIYTSSGATTLSVTGTPEFDDIAKSVTRNNAGWNLVANPYPSTIDWLAFTSENSNITEMSGMFTALTLQLIYLILQISHILKVFG